MVEFKNTLYLLAVVFFGIALGSFGPIFGRLAGDPLLDRSSLCPPLLFLLLLEPLPF